ncbi:MAG: Hsp20/alpha crystallin family protein [Clostridia bacterium]|nr:Hsp20/alpha crystallin family protein [Clostridia bacterium]
MFNSLVPFSRNVQALDSIFDKFFNETMNFPASTMKVDIKDGDKEYLLEAEIPGVNKEQIKLDYQNNYLTISVEQQNELKEEKNNYIRRERYSNQMSRSFYIEDINHNAIKASYKDGVLKVSLPKEKNIPAKKKIEIQ